jgi:hypothetical protein
MKRRFNWTGRKQIPLDHIDIRVVDSPEPLSKKFTADLSRLVDLNLDPAARIYVEPYVKSSSMRFDFGTVGDIRVPGDTQLTDLDFGGSILFRIKVVDESGDLGRLLASANEVRPRDENEDGDDKKAILPLRLRDLGEKVWMIDVDGAARPELVINNRISGLADRLRDDPLIQGAIIPEAIRRVLHAALVEDEVSDDVEWVQDWKKFAESLLGEEIPHDAEAELLTLNIDVVIEKYCSQMRFAARSSVVTGGVGVVHDY